MRKSKKLKQDETQLEATMLKIAAREAASRVIGVDVKVGEVVFFADGTPAQVEAVGRDGEEGWFRVRYHKGEYTCEAFLNESDIGTAVYKFSDMEKKERADK